MPLSVDAVDVRFQLAVRREEGAGFVVASDVRITPSGKEEVELRLVERASVVAVVGAGV